MLENKKIMEKEMNENFESFNIRPKVMLTIQIRDKNGNIIKEIKKENDPLTRWALRTLYARMVAGRVSVKDEGGGTRTFWGDRSDTRWSYKIAIGMDKTPFTFEDYKLYAKERETTAITVTALTEFDSTAQFDIKYDFLIETEKTFYEFGLFGYGYDGTYYYSFLVSRDVVDAGVTVPANSYLTIIYRVILGTT